jgi:D-alanyl-D-alanine carboxypeptidase/D-alanyl-D-alanine-endopeptidase (penicillin-binding protein 4)
MTMDNRVSAEVLGGVLRIAAADETGRFSPMVGTFPVGGVSGTLAERFDDPDEAAARSVTRAKTGTLNVVTALSGQTIRPDGHPVVVVVVFDDVEDTGAARDAADRLYALVAADGA